jgi:hypothetical protein
MDWLELIDWKTTLTGIGIAIGALGLYWTVLPDEKKYALRLNVGLIRPDLVIKIGGNASSHGVITKHFVQFYSRGIQVPYDVELEIWEPTDRWTVRLEDGQWITGNAKKITDAGGATEGNPRWNKYRLKPPEERKQIGHVDVKTSWQGPASDDEHFRWRLSCLGVKIAQGKERVPLQRRES